MLLARWRAALTEEGRRGRPALLVAEADHQSSSGVDAPAPPPPPRLVVVMGRRTGGGWLMHRTIPIPTPALTHFLPYSTHIKNRPISYGDLNAQSDSLASTLLRGGHHYRIRPRDCVGVDFSPSEAAEVVALLALLKCQGQLNEPTNE